VLTELSLGFEFPRVRQAKKPAAGQPKVLDGTYVSLRTIRSHFSQSRFDVLLQSSLTTA
jgi:hypothetical protein